LKVTLNAPEDSILYSDLHGKVLNQLVQKLSKLEISLTVLIY